MKSPFPGMDPFIEARGLWSDFHHKMITGIHDAIADQLPPQFVARIDERNYVDLVDPLEELKQRRVFVPDVVVERARTTAERGKGAGVATAEPDVGSVVMHPLLEVEQREIYLEIWELDPQRRLVTCIEVLSPTNKRYGSIGWNEYERKRQLFFQGHANLVEIDLLRSGKRLTMVEPWPASPYYVMVVRKEHAPESRVWPAFSMQPLPRIPIPLIAPHADIILELQPLVDAIYHRSRYSTDVQYELPVELALRTEESEHLQRMILERKG
jgi:uncharacterized protein DUF4058